MIYDYITTKPPLDEDTLAHYGIKGMKWKNHIYAVKNAVTNGYSQARNRVLTMLPQLQNRLNAGISTARKKANAAYASGSKKASSMYSTARKKANAAYASGSKKARSMYSTARKKANAAYASGSKKARSMYSTARKKAKGSYYKGKSKAQEQIARYNRSKKGMMIGDVSSNKGTKLKRKSTVHISEVNGKSPQDIMNLINRKNKTYSGQANYLSGQRGSRRVKTTRVRKRR